MIYILQEVRRLYIIYDGILYVLEIIKDKYINFRILVLNLSLMERM